MHYLLSLPPRLIQEFHQLENRPRAQWFTAADPPGQAIGSGGGSAHLLHQAWLDAGSQEAFEDWLQQDRRILIHGGGKSRRLPAYAPVGKMLTPIPVFRWEKGQDIDQKLLDIQLPFYEKILAHAPKRLNTLIASGDILILDDFSPGKLPDVDILLFGTWTEAAQASRHGVFFSPRNAPDQLAFMLQKPSQERIQALIKDFFFLMDIGVWLLSDKALQLLMQACRWDSQNQAFHTNGNHPGFFDLYGQFSDYLGNDPVAPNEPFSKLTSAVVPLQSGAFYHYGTSRELINATYQIQNKVTDQRAIWHKRVKPHPRMFVMNALHKGRLSQQHQNIWIENAFIPESWKFSQGHIFTGIPENQWKLEFPAGICLNVVPTQDTQYCLQPYGIDDTFRGSVSDETTQWLNKPLSRWLENHSIKPEEAFSDHWGDIHQAPLFPVVPTPDAAENLLKWMLADKPADNAARKAWLESQRLSAAGIQAAVNLQRLYAQRQAFSNQVLPALAANYQQSIFYQLDLERLSDRYAKDGLPEPEIIQSGVPAMEEIHNRMLLARIHQKKSRDWQNMEKQAFQLLKEAMLHNADLGTMNPKRHVLSDQIVWARSPVRLDLAGGWSDTPPYCIINGGKVMNLAVELNGQPPVQVYITPSHSLQIRIKSIDLGQEYRIETYQDLEDYDQVGAGFTIAKAALMLSGFHPSFGALHGTLKAQLKDFGGGFDISLLAAIPKGSGLGTSSVLAATLLGALAEYCGLERDEVTLGQKTLLLEQLLTTGGGWQDQYGGILPGAKLIETAPGFGQAPEIRWLPEHLFRNEAYQASMLLYYTGVTRVAKNILGEIVRRMFLNHRETLGILNEIKANAVHIAEAIRKNSLNDFNERIAYSWQLNQRLDSGTKPDAIRQIISPVEDYLASCKLAGAGGGGYLLMVAKDPEAAARIKNYLRKHPPNNKARFVDFQLSASGLSITKS